MRFAIASCVLAVGCVDGFRGSNVQIDLSPGTPVQAGVGQTPGMREIPAASYLRLSALEHVDDAESSIEIQRFELHKIVDVASPCFIDVGDNVPFPGLHVSEFQHAMEDATGITDLANPPAGATEQQQIDAATAV